MKRTELTIKSNINSSADNFFPRHSIIKPEPGIEIWYATIPDLMNSVFSEKKYSGNFKARRCHFFKEKDFIPQFFCHEELQTINNFKALKKQIEWMAGRCLIKQMVLKYSSHLTSTSYSNQNFSNIKKDNKIKLCDIIVAHRAEGAPFFKKWPFPEISISHSGKYAATAMCTIKGEKIGIDIEKIGKIPDVSFMKIAFTEKEIANMKHYPENTLKGSEEVFKKWTIKEAFLKYIKKGFNESLHRVEIFDDQILHNGRKADVSIFSKIIGKGTGEKYFLSMVN